MKICKICNVNNCDNKGHGIYRSTCKRCYKYKLKDLKFGDTCEKCNFKAIHPCQLDIHHIDKNHFNNESSNLQILCANCHRLEHAKNFG